MKKHLLICVTFFYVLLSQAQIEPDINSGNPTMPFPQFLPYTAPGGHKLENLGTINSPGVPHAELEFRMREAYEIMCNNIVKTGDIVAGIDYLYPDGPAECHCAESDGYFLLAAALMADKTTFDGLFMLAHDRAFNRSVRFIDGVKNPVDSTANTSYVRGLSYAGGFGSGSDPRGGGIAGNSATDGDVDIALALLMAYKQWGEWSGITPPAIGKEINYKDEAIAYISAIADTSTYWASFIASGYRDRKYLTGDIGVDGYVKRGDSWVQVTDWGLPNYAGVDIGYNSGDGSYTDYNAPAWFHQFNTFLNEESVPNVDFVKSQYERAEASSDWLIGELYDKAPSAIPVVGRHDVDDVTNEVTFGNYVDGEDFRSGWRTAMNYVWHGNPTKTWDPESHQVKDEVNTAEYDMAIRFADFYSNQSQAPWGHACDEFKTMEGVSYTGPTGIKYYYTAITSEPLTDFNLNYIQGTVSPSVVVSQDVDLMGDLFRQCVIEYDVAAAPTDANDPIRHVDAQPIYFHEWFRMLGMLTVTGQFYKPEDMVAAPNVRVYHDVDKTFGFSGDEFKFNIEYRNYGSIDAPNTRVSVDIPNDLEVVSVNKGGVVSGNTVIWNIGNMDGFKTGFLNNTMDSVEVVVRASSDASGRYCITPTITWGDGSTIWSSNEYPNNITMVMERNCIDIIKRSLVISKTASQKLVNPGDEIDFEVDFENSSDAGWLDGGRPDVRVTFANDGMDPSGFARSSQLKVRLLHGANEPYIDYGNYRISYYINEPSIKTVGPGGWGGLDNTVVPYEGGDPLGVKAFRKKEVPGTSPEGSWDQRLVIEFADQKATITPHLLRHYGKLDRVHEGGLKPLRGVWEVYNSNDTPVNWFDDWSWDENAEGVESGTYYPIGDDWTDPLIGRQTVSKVHVDACETAPHVVTKVLVEEWDGYVWRRAFGNGPAAGRTIENVVIVDTIPDGFVFQGFIGDDPLGIAPTLIGTNIIRWEIPELLINEKGSIKYRVKAAFSDGMPCPHSDEEIINNAWVYAATESPVAGSDTVMITCEKVVKCAPKTSVVINSDKAEYQIGDPITYTLNYEQNHGYETYSSFIDDSNWLTSGTGFSIGGGKLLTTNGADFSALFKYSHGNNTMPEGDGIKARLKIQQYESISLLMRYNPADQTGIRVLIKAENAEYVVTVYSNGEEKSVQSVLINPASLNHIIEIQAVLEGDELKMWLGDGDFGGTAPIVSVSDLVSQAGYSGVRQAGEWASNELLYWSTYLDSGFDIFVKDNVPEEIINVSNVSNSGSLNSGVIEWVVNNTDTPKLYGSTEVYTWEGEYNACVDVVNSVNVVSDGVKTGEYGGCLTVSCGSIPACTAPPTVVLSPSSSTNVGNSDLPQTIAITSDVTGYDIEWSDDNGVLPAFDGLTSIDVTTGGNYTVTVFDASDPVTCTDDASVEIIVCPDTLTFELDGNSITDLDIVLCPGETKTVTLDNIIGATNYKYDVRKGPLDSSPLVDGQSGVTHSFTITDADVGSYFVSTVEESTSLLFPTCGFINPTKLNIIAAAVPTGSFVINGDTDVCEDSSYTYEITGGVGATDYEWTLPTGVTLTSDTTGLDSYQITVTIGAGAGGQLISVLPVTACTQAASTASTTLNLRNDCVPPPTCTLPLPVTIATTNDTLCKNSTIVDLSVVLESGYAYSWYEVSTGTPLIQNTAETVDDNSLLAVATGGDYAVWVHEVGFGTDLSCLVGDTITIIEEDVPSGVLNLTGVATVCPNEMGVVYSVDIDSDASDYRWEVPVGTTISDTTGKNSNSVLVDYGALAGDVKVTSFNKCGDGVSDVITVSVSNKPAEPVVTGVANEDTLCVGQVANLVADVPSVWYVDGVQLDSNVTIFNHTMLSNPDVIIEVAAIGSCGISDFVSIELRSINIPSVGSIVGAMEACKISPEGYSATGFTDAEKYEWTINNLAVFNPVTDSTNAVTVDFNAVTTNEVNISVRAKNKFCGYGLQVDSTINIVTNLTPAVSIVQMDTVCSGSDQLFKAVVESGGDSPMFVWNSGVPTVSDEFTLVGALGGETISLEMTSNSPCVTGSPIVNAIPKTVVIDELPVTAIINETGPIENCLDTTSLSANAAVGGYWTKTPLTVELDSVANHVDVTKYLPSSITTITWNIPSQYGKCVPSSDSIDINKLDKPSEPTISTISGDDKICMGEAVQVVGATVAPIIEWSGDVGLTNTSLSTALFTPTSSGNYDLKLKVSSSVEKGCADSAIVSVEVFDLDKTVAISSLKTEECEGVAVNFKAVTVNADYNYIWTPVPTSSNTINNSSVDYVFGIAGMESISVSVDVSSACPDLLGSKVIATDNISFTVNGKPDVVLGTVITGNDEPCSGIATYTYSIPTVTNADSYSWSYPNGWTIQGVSDQNTIDLVSSSLSESGIIEVTAANSCGDLIVADLSVLIYDSSPKINEIDFDDREYCDGEEVLFTANVDKPSDVTDYIWYVDGNKESSSTNLYSDKIKEGETVSLAIRFVSCDGTPGHDSTFTVVNVLVPEEPTITAQVDDKLVAPSVVEVCTEQSVLLQANGSGSMLWSTPNGNIEGDVITLNEVKMSDLGTYSVQSFQGACGYYPLNGVALDLEVNRLPYLNFVKEGVLIEETKPAYYVYFESEKQVISLQGANLLDAIISFEGSAFATDLVNKSDNSAEFTTNAELGEFWEYIATATNQFNGNCVAKDTVSLSVVAELNPTSAFTPNGDNINDTWKIAGMEKYPSAQVQIFNRWGHLVFQRIGLYNDEPWTGERNNKVMPTGTYYYVIELNHPDYPKPITGTITILE